MRTLEEKSGIYKIVTYAGKGAGGTSIIDSFCRGDFSLETRPTKTLDIKIKNISLAHTEITLNIWDMPALEEYRIDIQHYSNNAAAFILVESVTDKYAFDHADMLIQNIRNRFDNPLIMVLFNKADLDDERVLKSADINDFCQFHKIELYQEVSAKEDVLINESFEMLVQKIMENQPIPVLESQPAAQNITPPDPWKTELKKILLTFKDEKYTPTYTGIMFARYTPQDKRNFIDEICKALDGDYSTFKASEIASGLRNGDLGSEIRGYLKRKQPEGINTVSGLVEYLAEQAQHFQQVKVQCQ